MRVFVGLDIDDSIRQRIQRFMDGVREFAPDARWVRPESLHVTLKFIGEKPPEHVEDIKKTVSELRAGPMTLSFRGYGFFPTAKAPRVFWIGIEAGPELSLLAHAVDEALARLGVPKEDHEFSPHLTLARAGGRTGSPRWQKADKPNLSFKHLQEKLAAMPRPDFGTMTAHEFYLYESKLSPGGARYNKVARFALDDPVR